MREYWAKIVMDKLDNGDYKITVLGTTLILTKEDMNYFFNNGQIEAAE